MAILVGKIMMLKKRWQFSAKMEIFELRSAQSQSTASQELWELSTCILETIDPSRVARLAISSCVSLFFVIQVDDRMALFIPVVPHKAVAEVSEIGNL